MGSIINQHSGYGRKVLPAYMNKELFIKLNGPPEHEAQALVSRVVDKKMAMRTNASMMFL